jgi:indole-3-glycerol phosphate synthase
MTNILVEIYQHKLIEVRERKKNLRLEEICKKIKCSEVKRPKDFIAALREKISQNKVALICEIKKASPSKGVIRENFNPKEIARTYEDGGAACLSVLTDQKYFQGADEYLMQASAVTALPILRKDFMVDAYQIYEAKMLGADCILLIVAMLDESRLQELEQCAINLGLAVLIEVHNEEELRRAFKLKSKLIGINNRNLKTLEVDLDTSLKLAPLVPKDYILVSESGIKNIADIKKLKAVGIHCFLIGEHFMLQQNFAQEVRLFADC